MLVPNFELGEYIESKASLLSKVSSIFINHLNCLACASDLSISYFLHTFLFLVSRAKEHAPEFFCFPLFSLGGFTFNTLGQT
jgi:hypothetical protein